jgi:branched-chain amino acid transport system substrate-binding protein
MRTIWGIVLVALVSVALAQRPAEIRLGIVTFLSGPASVFGIPAKNAADLLIDQ